MKRLIVILGALVFVSFAMKGKEKHRVVGDAYNAVYETTDGRLDGAYVSYYKNGQKKAEGNFENNYRKGTWKMWDTAGTLRVERDYENPFVFKSVKPPVANKKYAQQASNQPYALHYSKDGYMEYFKLEEKMVVWSKRLWRTITAKNNPLLFDDNLFFNILYKNLIAGKITPYDTNDEEFQQALAVSKIDTSSFKVIGYKIKEDCFFDNVRYVSETRIIGFCPVVVTKQKQDTVNLCWFYFPEMRKCLAQEPLKQSNLPTYIKTYDDLFFFRYFYGQIYKESNVWDRPISTYTSGNEIEKEAERIEITMIETEHDFWMAYAK